MEGADLNYHKVGIKLSILFLGDDMTEFSWLAADASVFMMLAAPPSFWDEVYGGLVSTVWFLSS